MTEDQSRRQDPVNCHQRDSVSRWLGLWLFLIVQASAAVWWAATMTVEVASLQEWRVETQANRYTSDNAERDRAQTRAEQTILRRDMEGEIDANRAFIRALCFSVSSLQEIEGIPLTNDCTRP